MNLLGWVAGRSAVQAGPLVPGYLLGAGFGRYPLFALAVESGGLC